MKKTKLATAVSLALAGSAGVLNTAQAVNVNPDRLGEVLLFPYYTVRNGNDTLISIVNTRDEVKAVKVRFLEGKNSKEVLDFNLYLSPFDVWTGALVESEDGVLLTSADNSCTVPAIPDDGVEFRNTEYAVTEPDGEDTSLDRTREGYIEIIEMGVVEDDLNNDGSPDDDNFQPESAATHVADVPEDCSVLVGAWSPGGEWVSQPTRQMDFNPGGLFGNATLINVPQGTDYSFEALAVEDFFLTINHTAPGETIPTLASGQSESNVFTGQGVQTSDWTLFGGNQSIDAISAVIMHDNVMNEFVTDSDLAAGTDWVVTFPTKRFYVFVNDPEDPDDGGFRAPFTDDFWEGGACEEVGLSIWNREERAQVGDVDFSPQVRGRNELCWEVNVITFNNTSVLSSDLELNVNTTDVGEDGWMRLNFPSDTSDTDSDLWEHAMDDDDGNIYRGLPVIGFAVQQYVNGNVDGTLSNYGGLFRHALTRNITSAAQ